MFLKNLFTKSDVLLNAEIQISELSTFKIIDKSSNINDRELILMGLLIYARILRVESSKKERDSLVNIYCEFHSNYQTTENKQEFLDSMLNTFSIFTKSYDFKDSVILKLKQAKNIYLDMGTINVYPLSSVVYTTFNFLWGNVSGENKIRLLEAFTLLSKMYMKEEFNMASAVEIPNMIIYDIIPF